MPQPIEVGLGLRDQFSRELRKPLSAIRSFGAGARSALGGLVRAFTSLKAAVLAVGAALALRQLARFVTDTANATDEVGKFARAVGVSSEFISELSFVAERSNVSFEQLQVGLRTLSKNLGDFRQTGAGAAAQAFRELGLQAQAFQGLNLEDSLQLISNRLSQVRDQESATATAFRLFGDSGSKFLVFLKDGAQGLADLREEARKLGISLSQDQVEAAAKFNDSVTNLKRGLQGLTNSAVLPLLPALTRLVDASREFVAQYGQEIVDTFRDIFAEFRNGGPEAEDVVRSFADAILFTAEALLQAASALDQLRLAYNRSKEFLASFVFTTKPGSDPNSIGSLFRNAIIGSFGEDSKAVEREIERLGRAIERVAKLRERLANAPRRPGDGVPALPTITVSGEPINDSISAFRSGAIDKDILEPLGRFEDSAERTGTAFQGLTTGVLAFAEEAKDLFNNLARDAIRVGDAIVSNLVDGFSSLIDRTKTAKEAFRDFTLSITRELSRIAANRLFTSIVGAAFGSIGNFLTPVGVDSATGGVQRGGVPLVQGPVQSGGNFKSGSVIVIQNLTTMDARSFEERVGEALPANAKTIGDLSSARYQYSPATRRRYR